jgi:hypothetical protein
MLPELPGSWIGFKNSQLKPIPAARRRWGSQPATGPVRSRKRLKTSNFYGFLGISAPAHPNPRWSSYRTCFATPTGHGQRIWRSQREFSATAVPRDFNRVTPAATKQAARNKASINIGFQSFRSSPNDVLPYGRCRATSRQKQVDAMGKPDTNTAILPNPRDRKWPFAG